MFHIVLVMCQWSCCFFNVLVMMMVIVVPVMVLYGDHGAAACVVASDRAATYCLVPTTAGDAARGTGASAGKAVLRIRISIEDPDLGS